MIYDVFISYRRDGGFDTAGRICDLLDQDGYSVSYDIDTLREGRFDRQLLERVEQCVDFILIVDKHAFDRIVDPASDPKDDWLRQELAYALKLKKNVIPVLLAGAKFPKDLPEDVREVAYCQGPKHSNEYFDSFYEKLKSYLHALPRKAADPEAENRAYFSQNAALPNLKIKSDMDCIFYLDGEEKARVKAGSIQKIPLDEGEYELRFVSTENPADFVETKFEMPDIDKFHHVCLCPVREKRLKKEARAEKKRPVGRLKVIKTREQKATLSKKMRENADGLIILPSSETKPVDRNRLPWIIGGAVAAVVLLAILLALLLGKGKNPIEEHVDPCEDAIVAASLILTNDSVRVLYDLEDYKRAVPALNIGWDTLIDCDPELRDQYVKHIKRVFDKELEKAYGKNNAVSIIQNGYSYTFFADTNVYNRMVELSHFHGFDSTGCKLPPDPKTKQTFEVKGVRFMMNYVEGGTFSMGCDGKKDVNCSSDAKPIHRVTLSTFYMGETEVTQGLWKAVMGRTISQQRDLEDPKLPLNGDGADYPVYFVSYAEAKAFCDSLNKLFGNQLPSGYSFSLPTEAEWEYAAKGGVKSNGFIYAGSDDIDEVAVYHEKGNDKDLFGDNTSPVKSKMPNELLLYDMTGNVSELCRDRYSSDYYRSSPLVNPLGPSSGEYFVCRGANTIKSLCGVTVRFLFFGKRSLGAGFRIALVKRQNSNSSSTTRSSNNSNANTNSSSTTKSSKTSKPQSNSSSATKSSNNSNTKTGPWRVELPQNDL